MLIRLELVVVHNHVLKIFKLREKGSARDLSNKAADEEQEASALSANNAVSGPGSCHF